MGLTALVLFGNKENPLSPQRLQQFSFFPLLFYILSQILSHLCPLEFRAFRKRQTLPIPDLVDRPTRGYSDAKRTQRMGRLSEEE